MTKLARITTIHKHSRKSVLRNCETVEAAIRLHAEEAHWERVLAGLEDREEYKVTLDWPYGTKTQRQRTR